MAIAKVILNGEVQMDVTSDTVEANKLLSGETATKNDGTKVTGTFVAPDPVISSLSVTPTESAQTFNEASISGYKPVTVGAIASDYIGSAVPLRDSADMAQSHTQVYTPSGYYSETAIYNLPTYSHLAPEIWLQKSTGYVYAEHNASDAIMADPPGILTGQAYTQSMYQLSTLSAQTITPTESVQYISSYRWLTGSQTIAAIPSSYIIPSGTYSVTENGTYDIGSYASVDVSVSGGGDYGDIIIQRQLSTISTIYSNDRVITIGLGALAGMSGITSFDFPNVTSVGSGAFSSCKSLKTINLPNLTYLGTGAFSFCTSLTDVNIPAQSIIRDSTFMACYSLSTFNFQSATSIANYAFYNCSSLTSVDAPLISGSKLGSHAFQGCNHLTMVSMPSIASIREFTFYGATRLESIYMPNAHYISSSAFASCTKLASIDIPEVWSIGEYAFYNCSSLTSVGLSKVTSILDAAFYSTALSGTLYLPSLKTLGTLAFANTKIESVDFPTMQGLATRCFYGCSLLTSISIPKCTIINDRALCGTGLSRIKLSNCSNIGFGAFWNASALSWVLITGWNTLAIGRYAFAECTSLISIYLLTATNYAYLLSSDAFDSTPFRYASYMGFAGSIFVRESMYSRYVTAPDWDTVSNRFVSLTDNEIDPIIHCGNVVYTGQMIDSTVSYGLYTGEAQFSSNLPTGSSYVLFDILKYKDTNGSYHLITNTPGVSFVASVNESLPHKSTGDTTYAVGVAFDHAAFMWQLPSSITNVSEVICDYTICEYNA